MEHIAEVLEKLANGIDITTGEVFDTEKYRGDPQIISAIQQLQRVFYNKKKGGIYQKYENTYPEHIIIMKEGYFYSAHNNSAIHLAQIMGYSVMQDFWGRNTTGGPNIDKIRQTLNNTNYSFIIVEKDFITFKKDGLNPFIDSQIDQNMKKSTKTTPDISEDTSLKTEEKISDTGELNCQDCMLLKRGDCFGEKEICDFFKFSPSVTQREKERWPQYGDATAFKLGERR